MNTRHCRTGAHGLITRGRPETFGYITATWRSPWFAASLRSSSGEATLDYPAFHAQRLAPAVGLSTWFQPADRPRSGAQNMPEKERGLRRRRNAGQNASGIHHDIARDVLPPPEMLSGTRTSCDYPWRFVLGCLSTNSGSADPPPRVKMLHTALMDDTGGGQVESFFFTGADGSVHRKAERSLRC